MTASTAILRTLALLRSMEPATAETARLPSIIRRPAFLVLAAILAVLVFPGFMLVRYAQVYRLQYEQKLTATAEAASLAIDALITRQIVILATLSHSSELKNRDWLAFYGLAKDSAADQPDARVAVYEPSGLTIFSTFVPYGTVLPVSDSPVSIRNVMQTKRLYISDLYIESDSKAPVVGIYLPVIEDGAVVNILSLVLPLGSVSKILQSQMQFPGGIASVFDRKDKLVARTRNESDLVGHPAAPGFREAMHRSEEGSRDFRDLEGVLVHGVFVSSELSGWSTSLAIEKGTLDAALWRSLWTFGSGGGLLFATALFLALYYGRGFVQPVAALTAMARSLDRGERLAQDNMRLREMQVIADPMFQTAETLRYQYEKHVNLLERLKHGNESLESANKGLESFAYSVSHDLRAPLRAIDGFSHVLQEDYGDRLDVEAQRLIQVIRDGVGKLAGLIEDILAFSRASRSEMVASDIDMTSLVEAALSDLAPTMASRSIRLVVAPLPPMRGDRDMMQRVWMNLLDNAIKFTGHSENALIEVASYLEAENTVYFVKDNGAGFDMAYIDKLFGVFQRLHGPEDFPGTGAGLAIVKRIVGRHGGRVWAEGKVGLGATFYFALPIVTLSDDAQRH